MFDQIKSLKNTDYTAADSILDKFKFSLFTFTIEVYLFTNTLYVHNI